MKEDFEEYISYFNKLEEKNRKEIICDHLEILSDFVNAMCRVYNIQTDSNIVLKKINKDSYSEVEFLEYIITYLNKIQCNLSNYNIGLDGFLRKLVNNNSNDEMAN